MWIRNRLVNPVVRAVLRSPLHRLLGRSLLLLAYTGRRSGRSYVLPVVYARAGDDLVIVAGEHRSKTSWRNFGEDPQEVRVLLSGREQRRCARRLAAGTGGYDAAIRAYRQAFPRVTLEPGVPVLILSNADRA